MPEPRLELVRQRLTEETNTALVRGLRLCLSVVLVVVSALAAAQITLHGPIYPTLFLLQLTQVFIVFTALRALRRQAARQRIIPIGIATFSIVYITVAAAGVVTGGNSLTPLLFCALAIATAALLPWGYRPQLFTVAVAGLALLANVWFVAAGDLTRTFMLVNIAVIGIALTITVVVAARIQHYREAMIEELLKREEAESHLFNLDNEIERRVAERTADLEAANRDLESFGYTVSHDLNAPLRSISAVASALIEDYGSNLGPDGLEQLARVRAGTRRMQDLVDGLLELSRVGREELDLRSVDLSEIARDIASDIEARGKAREAEFLIPDGIRAKGDPRMLQSVMQNLLENAWKYSRSDRPTRIEVGTEMQEGEVCYFVRDNGIGFNMVNHDRVFKPFEKLHSSDEFEGIGVGLTTAIRIVERHGGRLWAQSEPGEGSTFYFTLSPPGQAA